MLLEDFVGVTLDRNLYVFGSSKVFMKSAALAFMRAVVNCKMMKITGIIRKAWRDYKGTARIKSVEEAWDKLQEAIAMASDRGVDSIKKVKDALAEGQDQIGRVHVDLQKAKARHGEDVHKIGLSLKSYDSMLVTILSKAEAIAKVVETVADRKAAAEQMLSSRITKASAENRALQERLVAIEEDIADLEVSLINPEQKSLYDAAIGEAKERLEAIGAQELPEIRTQGPIALGFDLETDHVKGAEGDAGRERSWSTASADAAPLSMGKVQSLAPKEIMERRFDSVPIWEMIDQKLKEAVALVVKVEECGNILTAVRRDFANRAPEFLERFIATQGNLEAITEEAQGLMAEGLDGIGEFLDAAEKQQEHILELKHAAQDLDGFQAAVESFEANVMRLGESVQKGYKWVEKCNQERIRQETQTLSALPSHPVLMSDGARCLRALIQSATEIEARQREIEAELAAQEPDTPRQIMRRSSGMSVADIGDLDEAPVISEQETLESLLAAIRAAEEKLRKIGCDPAAASDAAPASGGVASAPTSPGVTGTYGFQPSDRTGAQSWSVNQTHNLGGEGNEQRFEQLAKLLDSKMVSSISTAVGLLNDGMHSCPEGFCVVWSTSKEAYFLLYSADKREEAFKRFALYD